jgi:hypothetical protein
VTSRIYDICKFSGIPFSQLEQSCPGAPKISKIVKFKNKVAEAYIREQILERLGNATVMVDYSNISETYPIKYPLL